MILYYGRYAYNKVYENKLKYIWQIFKECNKLMYVYVNAKIWGGNELFYTKFMVFIGKLLHIIFFRNYLHKFCFSEDKLLLWMVLSLIIMLNIREVCTKNITDSISKS